MLSMEKVIKYTVLEFLATPFNIKPPSISQNDNEGTLSSSIKMQKNNQLHCLGIEIY